MARQYKIDPRLVHALKARYCKRCVSEGRPRSLECLRCTATFDLPTGGGDMTHDGKPPSKYVEEQP